MITRWHYVYKPAHLLPGCLLSLSRGLLVLVRLTERPDPEAIPHPVIIAILDNYGDEIGWSRPALRRLESSSWLQTPGVEEREVDGDPERFRQGAEDERTVIHVLPKRASCCRSGDDARLTRNVRHPYHWLVGMSHCLDYGLGVWVTWSSS